MSDRKPLVNCRTCGTPLYHDQWARPVPECPECKNNPEEPDPKDVINAAVLREQEILIAFVEEALIAMKTRAGK